MLKRRIVQFAHLRFHAIAQLRGLVGGGGRESNSPASIVPAKPVLKTGGVTGPHPPPSLDSSTLFSPNLRAERPFAKELPTKPSPNFEIVLFLASDESQWVTGHAILDDGGLTVGPGFSSTATADQQAIQRHGGFVGPSSNGRCGSRSLSLDASQGILMCKFRCKSQRLRIALKGLRAAYLPSSSSSALAALRSAVSKPSLNHA